mgnify:CR=1 FL=1
MAVKKKFPYRSAVVACNGGCRVTAGDNGCKDVLAVEPVWRNVNLAPFP